MCWYGKFYLKLVYCIFNCKSYLLFILFFWFVEVCFFGFFGYNCLILCVNLSYGEYCVFECNCGFDEKCYYLYGCISILIGE